MKKKKKKDRKDGKNLKEGKMMIAANERKKGN